MVAMQLTALGKADAWILARPAVGTTEVLFDVSTSPASRLLEASLLSITGAGSTGWQVSFVALISLKPEVVRSVDVFVERVVVVVETTVVVLVIPGTNSIDVCVKVFVVVEKELKPSVSVETT